MQIALAQFAVWANLIGVVSSWVYILFILRTTSVLSRRKLSRLPSVPPYRDIIHHNLYLERIATAFSAEEMGHHLYFQVEVIHHSKLTWRIQSNGQHWWSREPAIVHIPMQQLSDHSCRTSHPKTAAEIQHLWLCLLMSSLSSKYKLHGCHFGPPNSLGGPPCMWFAYRITEQRSKKSCRLNTHLLSKYLVISI